jgi:hypothetical protein
VILLIDGVVVGHQRGMTVGESNASIDYSSKEKRHRRVGYGRYESTLSVESLYVPNASGYLAIQNASRDGTMVELIRRELGADFETAHAVITSVSGDFPDQGEAVIAVDFDIDDVWAAVP